MSTQYFGRAWKITVTPQATGEEWTVSNSGWEPQACRCRFEVEHAATIEYWFAMVEIYNFSPAMQAVIQMGDLVTIEAGYQSPGAGKIFQGQVHQPIWERENETDYKLTLNCWVNLVTEDQSGLVHYSVNGPISQADALRGIAKSAGYDPKTQVYLAASLESKILPRGVAFCGHIREYCQQVAHDNSIPCWIGWGGIVMCALEPASQAPDLVYAPPAGASVATEASTGITKYTLIGTPEQKQQGFAFHVVLDSNLEVGMFIKLSSALARKTRLVPMQQYPWLLNDIYGVVCRIRHTGDTRGNEWYSEVEAVSPAWQQMQEVRAL
jgi:hypothetical protein